MEITIQDIATALGTTPENLAKVFTVGAQQVGATETDKIITEAKAKSEKLLMEDRLTLAKLQTALNERSGSHGLIISQITSIRDALANRKLTEIPDLQALLDQIV